MAFTQLVLAYPVRLPYLIYWIRFFYLECSKFKIYIGLKVKFLLRVM